MKTLLLLLGALVATSVGQSFTFIINHYDPPPRGTGLPIKWPAGQIPMSIMTDNSATLGDGTTQTTAILATMQDPARGWNHYLGDAQFFPQVAPTGSGHDGNGVNEIFFASSPYGLSWDKNTLAVTTLWSYGNQRQEADIIFNTAYTWNSYRGPRQSGVEDIQRVAFHELGHVLGLDHPDDVGQVVAATMNSRIGDLDSLSADDIAGAQSLYGPPGVPANDNFANAIPITLTNGVASVTGYNTNATLETGEPANAANPGGRSVWWSWTAPASGPINVDTKGSYFDTTLGVYTGTSVSSLTSVATNDDINPGIVQASSLTFTATAGTTYYFSVDGFNASDGLGADAAGVTLNLSQASSAPAITVQPISKTTTVGSIVSLSVTAIGDAPLSYQWYFAGSPVGLATDASYVLRNVANANAGSYYVVVTNAQGSATSNTVTLTVNAAPVPTNPPGSSGGGGGAPSFWFGGALTLLVLARRARIRRN